MKVETIRTRVARGAALLDKTLADWDERIDLDRLDLESPCNCILGQEFTGHPEANGREWTAYEVGRDELFVNHDNPHRAAVEHGFDRDVWDSYGSLTAEWERVILARREGVEGNA